MRGAGPVRVPAQPALRTYQNRSLPTCEQSISIAAPGKTNFDTLVARTADRYRRGQESHRAEERNQHAGAGNQSKLGHPAESRRYERKKAGRGGQCRDQDGAATVAAPLGWSEW